MIWSPARKNWRGTGIILFDAEFIPSLFMLFIQLRLLKVKLIVLVLKHDEAMVNVSDFKICVATKGLPKCHLETFLDSPVLCAN